MITDKKTNPPPELIPEDSDPPLTDIKEPKNPEGEGVDIDDAQIEKPKDDAFKKAPQTEQPPKRRKKTGSSGFD